MAFQRIDEAKVNADGRGSTALVQDLANSNRAALVARGRGITTSFDRRNAPRLCGLETMMVPWLVRLAPGAETLTCELRGAVVQADVDVGLIAKPLSQYGRRVAGGNDVETAWAVAAEATKTLTRSNLDSEGLTDWIIVWITVLSDTGTETVIADGAGIHAGHMSRWRFQAVKFGAQCGAPFAAGCPQAAIQIKSYDPNAGEAVGDSTNKLYSHGTVTPFLPAHPAGPRQICRVWNEAAGLNHAFVWPPYSEDGTARNDFDRVDVAYWIQLGYLELYGVHFVEAVAALPAFGAIYNTGRPASARHARRLYQQSERVFGSQTRIHRAGPPTPQMEDVDHLDGTHPAVNWYGAGSITAGGGGDAPLNGPFSTASDGLVLTGSWEDLASCVIGHPDDFEDVDGVNKARARVEARALVAVIQRTRNPRTFTLRCRLRTRTAGTLANVVNGDDSRDVVVTATAQHPYIESIGDDPMAYLLWWAEEDTDITDTYRRIHSLRGMYPKRLWHTGPWAVLSCDVLDTDVDDFREVTLQFQAETTTEDGQGTPTSRNRVAVVLASWTVATVVGTDGDHIGV